jgi:hypothetical protein
LPPGAPAPEPVQAAQPEPEPVTEEAQAQTEPQPATEAEPVSAEAEEEVHAASEAEGVEQPPPSEEKKGVNLALVAGVFIGLNLLLGAIGFGVWWFLKKRNKTAAGDGENDEGEDLDASPMSPA